MIVAVIIILSALALALFFVKKSKITAIAFSVVLLVIGIVFIKEGQDLNQEQQSQNKVASQSKSKKAITQITTNQVIRQIIKKIINQQNHQIKQIAQKHTQATIILLD